MLRIRHFCEADIAFALEQTSREGWDSTRETFQVLLTHDPDGGFIAERAGCRIGMVTTTRYRQTGWVGNLIVEPAGRRMGLGERLMARAIERLESSAVTTLRLEADPLGLGIYRRMGFADEYESPRYRLDRAMGGEPRAAALVKPSDIENVLELDARAFGDERNRLLPLLLSSALASYRYPDKGRMRGFVVISPSAAGARLGPWTALDPGAAEALLATALHHLQGQAVVVALPGPNAAGCRLLERWGFARTPSSLRMIRGPLLAQGEPQELYGLASGAVG